MLNFWWKKIINVSLQRYSTSYNLKIKEKAYRSRRLLNVQLKNLRMKILDELTDEELALAYVEGNNSAFDLLLSRNEVKLFSYIMFVVHDEELANDIFQETFVKVITKLQTRQYAANGKFCAWCLRIAHNIIMDMYRRNKTKCIIEATENNDLSNFSGESVISSYIEMDIINKQVLSDVKKMVNLLPPTQREVVYMRYYQQMSFREIAELTNVSINTSLGRMRYALLNLRKMVKEHDVYLSF